MILYDFRCAGGHAFEADVPSMHSDNPSCPECGTATARRPSRPNIGGAARVGPSRDQMPRSWEGVGRGDRETLDHWHKQAAAREKLEERHPELAGDRRPVLAHEGLFRDRPLRAGDDIGAAVGEALRSRSGPQPPPP